MNVRGWGKGQIRTRSTILSLLLFFTRTLQSLYEIAAIMVWFWSLFADEILVRLLLNAAHAHLSGYKYRKISLFLVGFSSGALIAYLICVIRSRLSIGYVLLITAVVAIVLGSLCAILISFGLVAVGLAAGFCLSFAFLLPFATLYEYTILHIPVGVLIGTSVVMAGATVWRKRVFLIISSSLYGGALIMGCVDYFVESLWLLDYAWRKVFLVRYWGEPCFFSWIVLGIWPVVAIIGLIIQVLKTGKDPRKMEDADVSKHDTGTLYSICDLPGEKGRIGKTPNAFKRAW